MPGALVKQDRKKKNSRTKRRPAALDRVRVVLAGHVDHGKSSILGRLMCDAGLVAPEKIANVKNFCEQRSRPFEYAFLLDALSAERAQGVTIDAARVILRLPGKELAFIDAPGHADFLRNMVTGAAAADQACIVVDAQQGIAENTRAHIALLAILGVSSVTLLVNKMDLVGYREEIFRSIERAWRETAAGLDLETVAAVPVSAAIGDNIVTRSAEMKWYRGETFLEVIKKLSPLPPPDSKALRVIVQDVYKFTKDGDERRIVAGNVQSGVVKPGDKLAFYPSGKRATVKSLEQFPGPAPKKIEAGNNAGFTLEESIYAARGQVISRVGEEAPEVTSEFESQVFWLADEPLNPASEVSLLVGANRVHASVVSIRHRAPLFGGKNGADHPELGRGMTGLVRFRLRAAVAFDLSRTGLPTARFAIVRNHRISGGGLVVQAVNDEQTWIREKTRTRVEKWTHSLVRTEKRSLRFGQKPALIIITGSAQSDRKTLAKILEAKLFADGRNAYFLSFGNLLYGLDADLPREAPDQREYFRRLGEVANILLHAGLQLIVSAGDVTEAEIETVKAVLDFDEIVTVWLGAPGPFEPSLRVDDGDLPQAVHAITSHLEMRGLIYKA